MTAETVARYSMSSHDDGSHQKMEPDEEGGWVQYEEYAALLQAVTDPENQPSQFGTQLVARSSNSLVQRLRELVEPGPNDIFEEAALEIERLQGACESYRIDRDRLVIELAREREWRRRHESTDPETAVLQGCLPGCYVAHALHCPNGTAEKANAHDSWCLCSDCLDKRGRQEAAEKTSPAHECEFIPFQNAPGYEMCPGCSAVRPTSPRT